MAKRKKRAFGAIYRDSARFNRGFANHKTFHTFIHVAPASGYGPAQKFQAIACVRNVGAHKSRLRSMIDIVKCGKHKEGATLRKASANALRSLAKKLDS